MCTCSILRCYNTQKRVVNSRLSIGEVGIWRCYHRAVIYNRNPLPGLSKAYLGPCLPIFPLPDAV